MMGRARRASPAAFLALRGLSFPPASSSSSFSSSSFSSSSSSSSPPPHPVVDLRSDTLTKPTPAQRAAMAGAVVGDDVYGEDPTVAALERRVADLVGKEGGVFVPSGTMGNLEALAVHCGRGEAVLLGDQSHIYKYEGCGASALLGVPYQFLPNGADGTLGGPSADLVAGALWPDDGDVHSPRTACVALENTHNLCGGVVLPDGYTDAVGAACRAAGVALHVDGARLLNAAAATGHVPAALAAGADSVSVCLSKGVGAPVGSVVVGTGAFCARVRRMRKMLGGGMRQSGVLAAAAMTALDEAFDASDPAASRHTETFLRYAAGSHRSCPCWSGRSV